MLEKKIKEIQIELIRRFISQFDLKKDVDIIHQKLKEERNLGNLKGDQGYYANSLITNKENLKKIIGDV